MLTVSAFARTPEDKKDVFQHFYQPLTLSNTFPKAGGRHELLLSRITQYLNAALKLVGNTSTLKKTLKYR